MVLRILKLANHKNTLEISKIIRLYKKRDLQESFDVSAFAVLEVLPFLIPVRNKKGVVASKFLYYPQELVWRRC